MEAFLASLASQLLKSLAGAAGSAVGCKAIATIFKERVPDFFPKVYKEIEKILEQKLEEKTIREINKKIKGLITWVICVYRPKKENGLSKAKLHRLLEPKVSKLAIEHIPLLQGKDNAGTALGAFISAASLHLSLLQELALVDPDVTDPLDSAYLKSVKAYAFIYIRHAKEEFHVLTSARKKYITKILATTLCWKFSFYDIFKWEDKFVGDEFVLEQETDRDAYRHGVQSMENIEDSRARYISDIVSDLSRKSNDLQRSVDVWNSLLTNPMPQSSVPQPLPDISPIEAVDDIDIPEALEHSDASNSEPTKRKKNLETVQNKAIRFLFKKIIFFGMRYDRWRKRITAGKNN